MKKAFTITELLVAIGLLAIIMAGSGVVFSTTMRARHRAAATAEISRKLRAVTDQLNTDFKGLRKDGLIFVAWTAGQQNGRYIRDDRILFFANGDFQSYGADPSLPIVRGNVARICYTLADDSSGKVAMQQKPRRRILARSQHILTADESLPLFPDLENIPVPLQLIKNEDYIKRNQQYEYDIESMAGWKNLSMDKLAEILTVATGIKIKIKSLDEDTDPTTGGLMVDPEKPENVHLLLCEGISQFSIQGWYDNRIDPPRWFPQVDPDGDDFIDIDPPDDLSDSDFPTTGSPPAIDPNNVAAIIYHPRGVAVYGDGFTDPVPPLDEANFNNIPGLGRAFKFTFTIYDSKGVFTDGKTFSHIVYLDD